MKFVTTTMIAALAALANAQKVSVEESRFIAYLAS
jgi:hypothetical protein